MSQIVFFYYFLNFKNSCLQRLLVFYLLCLREKKYRMGSIITCPCFETALNYKLLILDQKFEEFPCLVHTLSVTLTALQYKLQWKWDKEYTNGVFTLYSQITFLRSILVFWMILAFLINHTECNNMQCVHQLIFLGVYLHSL